MLELGEYVMGRIKGRVGQEWCSTYEFSKKRTDFVWNAAGDPLTYQPQMEVLRRKHDSREQVHLFCSRIFHFSSNRKWNSSPIATMLLMNQRSWIPYCDKWTRFSLLYMYLQPTQPIQDEKSCITFSAGYTYLCGVKRKKIRWSEISLTPS